MEKGHKKAVELPLGGNIVGPAASPYLPFSQFHRFDNRIPRIVEGLLMFLRHPRYRLFQVHIQIIQAPSQALGHDLAQCPDL